MNLTYGELSDSPLGPISFSAGDLGLRRGLFGALPLLKAERAGNPETPSLTGMQVVADLLVELNEYLFGIRKFFTVAIDWGTLTPFQKMVLTLTSEIPYGEVRTYADLATESGTPGAARAVGHALATNPMPIVIPCHRVVGSDRRLRGYAAPDGIQTKAFLLGLEGNRLEGDRLK